MVVYQNHGLEDRWNHWS